MSAPVDVLTDLRDVVRIAKAASFGVPGNAPRIERAEKAIAALATLIAAAVEKATDGCPCDSYEALRVAVRNCGGDA
ncbi:hypothetical protein [Stenotrophomonas acidaminiphila]|jgi:hypothetical protein